MWSSKGRTHKQSSKIDELLKQSDDCDRPACDEMKSFMEGARSRNRTQKPDPNAKQACPPGKDKIGNSSWTLLHSMVAWYPETPTSEEQKKMKQFMEALSTFYPCTYCAADFKENLKRNPPK